MSGFVEEHITCSYWTLIKMEVKKFVVTLRKKSQIYKKNILISINSEVRS